jgi:hypothetical protein
MRIGRLGARRRGAVVIGRYWVLSPLLTVDDDFPRTSDCLGQGRGDGKSGTVMERTGFGVGLRKDDLYGPDVEICPDEFIYIFNVGSYNDRG